VIYIVENWFGADLACDRGLAGLNRPIQKTDGLRKTRQSEVCGFVRPIE